MLATDHTVGLTQERLKALVSYDPETGAFRRVASRRKPEGRSTGNGKREDGYVKIAVDGRKYFAHRLAWLYMTGGWPTAQVDHIDTDRANNRWSNLRAADPLLNSYNRRRGVNNTSGYKGVSYYKAGRNWRAYIRIDGVLKFLGGYSAPEIAHQAYVKAAESFFGPYARSA